VKRTVQGLLEAVSARSTIPLGYEGLAPRLDVGWQSGYPQEVCRGKLGLMSPRLPSAFRYDFAVYDRTGQIAVLLEAKRKGGTDAAWASEWHAMVVDRMTGPTDARIVLVALDHVYAWRPHAEASAPPDWIGDAQAILGPYFSRLRIEPNTIDPGVFEEIVGLWLRDLVMGRMPEEAVVGDVQDVINAIRDGEIVEQVAA
jgi:hypothetical protein